MSLAGSVSGARPSPPPRARAAVSPGAARAALRAFTVLVAGLGAVGGAVFHALARAGVGRLIGCDPDSYSGASHVTQPASWRDAGRPKALVQGERAAAAAPDCRVLAIASFVQDLPLSLLRQADILVAAMDNVEGLLHLAGRAFALGGRVLIQGAVHGPSWLAMVRGYDLRDPEQACPACNLSSGEWASMSARLGCDPAAGGHPTAPRSTDTIAPLCAATGELVALECVARLLGLEARCLSSEESAYCVLTHGAVRTRFPFRAGACRLGHDRARCVDWDRPPSATSLRDLAAAFAPGASDAGLQVGAEGPWISEAACSCGRRAAIRRFTRRYGATVGRCDCGADLLAGPAGAFDVLPAADLRAVWNEPLGTLGLEESGAAAGLRGEWGWNWVIFPGRGSPGKVAVFESPAPSLGGLEDREAAARP